MRRLGHLREPLERLFSAPTHIAILHALQHSREGMSGRGVARQAGINHQACAMALKNLEAMAVIDRRGSGKSQLIRLNFDNYLIQELILPLLRKEKDLAKVIQRDLVEAFKGMAKTITMFGSMARREDVLGSDFDVLLVVEGSARNRLLEKARAHSAEFKKRYGMRLSPIVMSLAEARAKTKKGDAFMKNILTEGVDLLPRKLREVVP